ncbi:MAG: carbonic anhydrase family protein [Sulfurisoma sp.]|nr:carbonic anhydrase family protein [Sulfurisoma sp.]
MKFRSATIIAAITATLTASQPALAAKWETVATANGDKIEIDRARIVQQAGARATAWSRLVRDGIYIDEYGMRYTTVEAFNRYDCGRGSFTTLKRVWRRDGQLVREEPIAQPAELSVEAASTDAKILAEACLQQPGIVAAREGKPGVMHADMRSAGDAAKAKTLPVADVGHGEKQVTEKPASMAAAPAATGDKPRFIELPKIDKSQVEDPNKASAAKDTKSRAAPDIKEVAKAAGAAAAAEKPAVHAPVPAASRQELERQYATSGPRKAVKKKAPAKSEAEAIVEHRNIHWSYEGEGAPGNWSKLDPKNAACGAGRRQSPIDIREGVIKVDLEPIKFDYKWTQFRVVDNGHTIQVNVGEGSTITVMGRGYQLVQFHFHRPSEEKVRGKAFDMVAHLVHKDDEGRLAVVAVLMEKGAAEHPLIQTLWNNMPLEAGQELAPATAIDLNRILPEARDYYTYMGSLTTPPCTEDVLWMVFKKPIIVTEQQVAIFARLYKNNARPVQPANDRLVKETR